LRAAAANNPLCDTYNPNEPTSYIMYWDMNNLYSSPLQGMLPPGNYRWVEEEYLQNIRPNVERFVNNIPCDFELGYFF